jgi:hypothetical protein
MSLPPQQSPRLARGLNAADTAAYDEFARPLTAGHLHPLEQWGLRFRRAMLAYLSHETQASDAEPLDQLAELIRIWQRATFPQATPASVAEHLRREALEFCESPTNAEEIADLFHLVVGAAQASGHNLAKIVAEKFAENRARQWGEPDAEGVVEHVKPAAHVSVEMPDGSRRSWLTRESGEHVPLEDEPTRDDLIVVPTDPTKPREHTQEFRVERRLVRFDRRWRTLDKAPGWKAATDGDRRLAVNDRRARAPILVHEGTEERRRPPSDRRNPARALWRLNIRDRRSLAPRRAGDPEYVQGAPPLDFGPGLPPPVSEEVAQAMRAKIADGSLADAEGTTLRDLGLDQSHEACPLFDDPRCALERLYQSEGRRQGYPREEPPLSEEPTTGDEAAIEQAFNDPRWSREASGDTYAEHEPGVPKSAEELTDYWLEELGKVRRLLSADVRSFLGAVAQVREHQRRGAEIVRRADRRALECGGQVSPVLGLEFDAWPDLRRAVGVHDA